MEILYNFPNILTGVLFVVLLFIIYFLPAFIAGYRTHKDHTNILLVNMFFGWSFVGWIVVLIWALSKENR